jgi:hypothetical protein
MPQLTNIKGSELPFYMLQKLNATPFHTFKITPETEVEYDENNNPMPPEKNFKKEFIKMVEESKRDFEEGRYKKFASVEELFEELDED